MAKILLTSSLRILNCQQLRWRLVNNSVAKIREETDRPLLRSEGMAEQQWVLLDYGDVVVHIFSEDIREFYEIERLYQDVPSLDWRNAS
ncbi:MAG: RsfS/YbeB/iojap family protein [Actinobacteria bacterium]|nr:RsfS/YbeB/iojap family protein [Actinomycetota bacterium]